MELDFDPSKARSNLRKHGVSFAHAEQALRDETAFTVEDPDAIGERRFITLGMDALGRVLVVVHTQRGGADACYFRSQSISWRIGAILCVTNTTSAKENAGL